MEFGGKFTAAIADEAIDQIDLRSITHPLGIAGNHVEIVIQDRPRIKIFIHFDPR